MVPHGGNTSYCGAATPDESGAQIVLSMRRLKRIRELDVVNFSMIVEAGVHPGGSPDRRAPRGPAFPLSLGSEGTAQIGGNLSTNAGGTAVLRYGMMRDLVLGLEVVLADGRVLAGLKSLRKDNTGYDVKSLFIGAEGTSASSPPPASSCFHCRPIPPRRSSGSLRRSTRSIYWRACARRPATRSPPSN